jgi:hypothetical protein
MISWLLPPQGGGGPGASSSGRDDGYAGIEAAAGGHGF